MGSIIAAGRKAIAGDPSDQSLDGDLSILAHSGESLHWQRLEAIELSLGPVSIGQFGPNGPATNVLAYCETAKKLFVANRDSVYCFQVQFYEGGFRVDSEPVQVLNVRSRMNRITTGWINGISTLGCATEMGEVVLFSTQRLELPGKIVDNRPQHWDGGTWGLDLATVTRDSPFLAVSANDFRCQSWSLSPSRPIGQPTSEGEL
jgi:hypothetical protein